MPANSCVGVNAQIDVDSHWVYGPQCGFLTGTLSERGFTAWGSSRIGEAELLAEWDWMERMAAANKTYYSINEVRNSCCKPLSGYRRPMMVPVASSPNLFSCQIPKANWTESYVEWVVGAFMMGQTNTSALWIGLIQGEQWTYFFVHESASKWMK